MARTTKLAQFTFEPSEDARNVTLHIEDETGKTLELTATREQLELLADSLDEFLADTEEADEIEGDEDDDEDEDAEEDGDDDEDGGVDGGEGGDGRRGRR